MSRLNLHLPPMFHGSSGGSALSGTDWKTAAWAGVIAGFVFLVAEMLLVWLFQGMTPWAPLSMIAAMALGADILTTTAGFSLMVMMTALAIHLPLSAVYGAIIGWLVHRFDMDKAVLIGLVFGLVAMYGVNFYLVAPAAFPWFVEARTWISALTHALFGMVAAGTYVSMRRTHRV